MLVVGLGAAGAAVLAADATGSDPSLTSWIQTGGVVGVLAFIVFAFMSGKLVSERTTNAKDAQHLAELATRDARILQLEQQAREKDSEYVRLIEKIAGPLEQSAQALKDSSQGYGRVVEEMRPPRNDIDVMLRRLEHAVDEIGRLPGKEP